MSRDGGWIITSLGRQFSPLDPDPLDIDIRVIAHHLANLCRFNGATRVHYSVAEHSVRVSRAVAMYGPMVALQGLLHDAPEAYLGDMVRPVKRDPEMAAYCEAGEQLLEVVASRFGLPFPFHEAVWVADDALLHAEARDLLPPCDESWVQLERAHPVEIQPWAAEAARRTFMNEFRYLTALVEGMAA